MTFARAMGYDCPEPRYVPLPRVASPRVKVWTSAQVAGLFEAARDDAPEVLPLLVWCVNTGCRKGEAIACEWSWIDEARGCWSGSPKCSGSSVSPAVNAGSFGTATSPSRFAGAGPWW